MDPREWPLLQPLMCEAGEVWLTVAVLRFRREHARPHRVRTVLPSV